MAAAAAAPLPSMKKNQTVTTVTTARSMSNPTTVGFISNKRDNPWHAKCLLDQFKAMFDSKELIDVVVCVENKQFPCHRAVLSACSPYFKAMFTSGLTECKKHEITLHEVDAHSVSEIINYAYTSKLDLAMETVQNLFIAANMFQIQFVQEACAQFMSAHVDLTNCVALFSFACSYNSTWLKRVTKELIEQNFQSLSQTDEFMELHGSELSLILASDNLNVQREEQVYDAARRWLEFDSRDTTRVKFLLEIIQQVRFSLMVDTTVVQSLRQNELIRKSPESIQYLARLSENGLPRSVKPRLGMGESSMIVCFGSSPNFDPDEVHRVPCFSIKSNEIFTMAAPPRGLWDYGVVVTKLNDLVVAGGCLVDDHSGSEDSYTSQDLGLRPQRDVYIYEHTHDRWHKRAPMLTERFDLHLVCTDSHVYAIGGMGRGGQHLDVIEGYDLKNNQWKYVTSMPAGLSPLCAIVYGSCIYVIQGDTFLSFDTEASMWSARLPSGGCLLVPSATVFQDELYFVAGYNLPKSGIPVQVYDPNAKRWHRITSIPIRSGDFLHFTCRPKVMVIDSKLHVLVKHEDDEEDDDDNAVFSLYQYSNSEDKWNLSHSFSFPYSVRVDVQFVVAGLNINYLYPAESDDSDSSEE
ncbi:kelch repeat and BTB domain-containing protein 8-like [Saccoglossus kowalevskii]|uniref:Kelch repeat and BTB domain-containing protein 8-like n=1 Tax=Saccoglossus kowalevskii TaxID=10224 RepID=A0ABM0GWP6_SACKO|nr:PREDICTED: kelch repeat and BTB domain-containing protein 8-like [Saccoglossus kowalevskii]